MKGESYNELFKKRKKNPQIQMLLKCGKHWYKWESSESSSLQADQPAIWNCNKQVEAFASVVLVKKTNKKKKI